MQVFRSRLSWGLLLIAGGILLLLQNLELLPESELLWMVVFGFVGLYFLGVFLSNPESWWAAFPAFGSLGIAATLWIAASEWLSNEIAGAAFLGLTALGFIAIYLRTREHWWPLIPGGLLATITGIILVDALVLKPPATLVPTILFGGFALTFLLLALAPAEGGRARWALWPAAGLSLGAVFFGVAASGLGDIVLPAALIALGIVILIANARRK